MTQDDRQVESKRVPVPSRIKCARCGYPLLGLPPVHACPECGLGYDPDAKVFPLSSRTSYYTQLSAGVLLLVTMVMLLWPAGAAGWSTDMLWFVALIALLIIRPLYGMIRYGRGPRFVFASHRGVELDHPDFRRPRIEWSQFGRAWYSFLAGRFRIIDTAGRTLLDCGHPAMGGAGNARRCAKELNRLAGVYGRGQRSSEPPTTGGAS